MNKYIKQIIDNIKFIDDELIFAGLSIGDKFESADDTIRRLVPELVLKESELNYNLYSLEIDEENSIEITITRDFETNNYLGKIEFSFDVKDNSIVDLITSLCDECIPLCDQVIDDSDATNTLLNYYLTSTNFIYSFFVSKHDSYLVMLSTEYNESIYDVLDRKKTTVSAGTINSSNPATLSNSVCDPIDQLNNLIGLVSVKQEIISLNNLVKIQQMRVNKGLSTMPMSYHCVFTGNPGTGKTTVARIIAQIYKELGILEKGHLIETDRSGLVANYVGQTATKTNAIIDSALDGVLFIDEAYSLVQGGGNDYGKEAISTLLKRMEDNRDRLVVILAGYTHEMEEFINSNSGLQSRFNKYIEFPDYSTDELIEIFLLNLKKNDFQASNQAIAKLRLYLENIVAHKNKNFGNARFIRNLFEKVITQQANRLASYKNITTEDLSIITIDDIQNAL